MENYIVEFLKEFGKIEGKYIALLYINSKYNLRFNIYDMDNALDRLLNIGTIEYVEQ